ncbi:MAG: hypothetical protein J6O71_02160 [Lachnospiraceae bacterium]|nr:hypothetical protein [Lachnospiraceae bacterium]
MMKTALKIIAGVIITTLLSIAMSLPAAASIRDGFGELHIRNIANYKLNIRKDMSPSDKKSSIFEYSEYQKQQLRNAGLEVDVSWEEINRRQIEYRKKSENRQGSYETTASSNQGQVQNRNYGLKNSYDEFHTAPTDIPANDGYKSGNFDELHINENYRQNIWHPENRGGRLEGFDEFHYPDEL